MIEHLSIKNFAVIRELEVPFSPGLNVITGETGSGKSILIDAIGLLVGGRAAGDMVRTGEAVAVVEGEFVHDGSKRLVRRLVRAGGASRSFVDDAPLKLAELESLSGSWVDLHGQHEHQSLLRVATHIDYLDDYAGLRPDREVLAHTYHHLVRVSRELAELTTQLARDKELHELHVFQLRELDAAHLSPAEEAALDKEHKLLSQADELHRLLATLEQRLQKDQTAVAGELSSLLKKLDRFAGLSEELDAITKRLTSLRVEAEDVAYEVGRFGTTVKPDPRRLSELEGRLAELEALKRKYGGTIESALRQMADLREAVDRFAASDERLGQLQTDRTRLEEAYAAECLALSSQRNEARGQLAQAIMDVLARLDMPGTEIVVRQDQTLATGGLCVIDGQAYESDSRGYDQVEFYISPNPGEDLRPLAKIASGGEVSRIMLGIKTVLAEFDPVGTLIFDEIDSGISGSTAESVGVALADLARSRQVIVITHLPQIAARGSHHLTISKRVEAGRTMSRVQVVENESRQREVARLLSGADITNASLDQAAELLASPSGEPALKPDG